MRHRARHPPPARRASRAPACAAASAVISAWSNGGDTSTMSMPTRSSPPAPAPAPAPASSRARPAPASRSPARRPGRARRCRRRGRPARPRPAPGSTSSAAAMPLRCIQGAVRTSSPSAKSWNVRIPTCVERARSTSPSRIARPIIVPWSIRPGSSGHRSPCASTCTSASGPYSPRGPEQRPGDEVVAAERQQLRSRRDHLRRRRLDRRRHGLRMVRVEHASRRGRRPPATQGGRSPRETP